MVVTAGTAAQSVTGPHKTQLSNTQHKMGVEDNEHHRRKNAYETFGSRNLMEQVTAARAKVDMYFGKVFLKLVDNLD